MTRPLQSCYSLGPMAYSKPRSNRPMPGAPSGLARALGADGLAAGAYRLTVGLTYDLIEIPALEL